MAEPRAQSNPVSSPLPMLPRIVNVYAEPKTHTVIATFATGERRRYDVSPLLDTGIFGRIQDANAFVAVHVDDMGGIIWEAGPVLSRDTVYLGGKPA